MPTIPKFTLCLDLGCKSQRSKFNAYCMEHGGKETFNHSKYNDTDKRKASNQKYSTKQWRTLRQIQLSRHPLCAACLNDNKITPAIHLDHLFPWNSIGDTAFYHNIFQSLCQPCHSVKTALEQRGIYRQYTIPPTDFRLSDYERLINPKKISET
jgi:5-methylcytosine-specific restriction protein A